MVERNSALISSGPMAHRMSEDLRVRRRTRLRDKEAKALRDEITAALGGAAAGTPLWDEKATLETGEFLDRKVLLANNQLVGLWEKAPEGQAEPPGPAFLGVRGLLLYKPKARYVTVDMGAVKFVANGADIMAPGIVEADPALQPGDWCWIRDERNKQPLAVGKMLVPGAGAVRGKGKAVKSVHYLGDKLWSVEV